MPESCGREVSRRRSMGGSTRDRRPMLKALVASSAQERRRQEFLSSQKKARRDLSDHARLLATLSPQESDSSGLEIDEEYSAEGSSEVWTPSHEADEDMAVDMKVQGLASAGHKDANGMMNENGMEVSAGQALDSEPKGKRSSRRNRGGHSETGVSEKVIKQRDHWANQLCTPEWMLTVPSDLDGAGNPVGAGWYVMARPEGKRVLIISAKGETVARQMSGAVTHRFSSNLPGGSPAGRREGTKLGGYCILDCVFHELDQTFFVLDMMAWKGYPLYDCYADFRFFWVRTKLEEADGPLDIVSSRNAYRIKSTPYHECDRQGLAHAYSSPVPFIKDGLLFYFKAAHYQLGPTPLVLLWKDDTVTRYLRTNGQQAVVLRVEGNPAVINESSMGTEDHATGERLTASVALSAFRRKNGGANEGGSTSLFLWTCDGVCLGEVGREGSPTHVPQAMPGELLRFTLTGAEEELVERPEVDHSGGTVVQGTVHGLQFDKRCSLYRPMADSWSKVLYQARLRRGGGVGINDIDAVCVASTSRSIAGGSAGGNVPLHREEPSNMENDDDDML